MAKQKDKLTLLKEELEALLNKGNKTPADIVRQGKLVKDIQYQENLLGIESKTITEGKIEAEGKAIFGDAYIEASKKGKKAPKQKKVTPTFKGSTTADKLARSDFRSRGWRERNFPTGIPGLPLEGNEAAMKRARATKKKIKKEFDLAKGSTFVNPADKIGIDLPDSIYEQIKTTARGLVESNPAGIDPSQQERFIQDVADEMAAQVEEAARTNEGKLNIMDFSEGNPMLIDTANGAVKDMGEGVGTSKAAKAYVKEFNIDTLEELNKIEKLFNEGLISEDDYNKWHKAETKSLKNNLFNISIRTLEGQLDMINDTIENTKGEILNVEENLTPRILDIERVNQRNAAAQKTVDGLEKQKKIITDLLEEQVLTLNKETAYRYLQGKGVIKGQAGSKALRSEADKVINKLNITGDRIIDVDDLDIMYTSKFEKKIQKDAPVTKEQLIMTESERLISSWQKQISPGSHNLRTQELAEQDAVDPDAAKYQTKKEAEGSIKFKKSQSPMTNLLKNSLQDAGSLPGEAGMISERMEYTEGVNEPRGREWWSEGEIIESTQPSTTKGQKDIGSFRGIGDDIDATGFQIKAVAGQQIDKALAGEQIRKALKNPAVLEVNTIFGYKPNYELSGTLQIGKKGAIEPFAPMKDEYNNILNLDKQLKVKHFIDKSGGATKAAVKYGVNVPKKPDPTNYAATDDFKKAEIMYLDNLERPARATVYSKDLPEYAGPDIELRARATNNIFSGAESKDVDVTITGNLKDTSYTAEIEVPDKPAIVPTNVAKADPIIQLKGPLRTKEFESYDGTKQTITESLYVHKNPQKQNVAMSKKVPQTKTVTQEIKPGVTQYGPKYKHGLRDIAGRGIEIPGKVRVTDYGTGAEASFKVSDSAFRMHLATLGRVKDTKFGQTELTGLAKGLKKGEAAKFAGLDKFNIGSQKVFDILYGEAIEVRDIKKGVEESLMKSEKKITADIMKNQPAKIIIEKEYGHVSGAAVSKFITKHDLWKKDKEGKVLVDKAGKKVPPASLKGFVKYGGKASNVTKKITTQQYKQIAPTKQKYLFESESQRAPKQTFQYKATGILSEKNKFTHLFKQEDYTTLRKSYEKDLAWKAYTESVKNKKGVKKYSSSTDTGTLLKASDPAVVNKYLSSASSAMSGDNISQNFYKKDGTFDTGKLTKLAQQRILHDAGQFAEKMDDTAGAKKFLTELKKGIKMVIKKG